MILIDAHCHLANLAELMPLEPLFQEATEQGITRYVSSVLRQKEIEWHRLNPYPNLIYSAGIHPNFDECDLKLQSITQLCENNSLWAIGEIGLDRNNPDLKWQTEILNKQLELAVQYELPVVLHIVGHQNLAGSILREYPLKYMVHGYAGSVEGFAELARLDSLFTISQRILKDDKRKLLNAILESGRYLFETDITQYYVKTGENNPLLRLIEVVETCARISGIDPQELINTQYRNAQSYAPNGFLPH